MLDSSSKIILLIFFYRFDASSGEWTAELAAIDKEYYEYTALQMVAYNDCLYVIADNMHGHTITFCYNPKLNKWNRLADVLINSESDLEQCQLFVRNDVLTFIHTFDELINIYVYDLKADNWNVSQISVEKNSLIRKRFFFQFFI